MAGYDEWWLMGADGGGWDSGAYGASAMNAGVPTPETASQPDPWSDGSYDYNYGGAGMPSQFDPWANGSYDYSYGGGGAGTPTKAPVTENQGSGPSLGSGLTLPGDGSFAITPAQSAGGDFGGSGSEGAAKNRGLGPQQPNMLNQARTGPGMYEKGFSTGPNFSSSNRNTPVNDNPIERNIGRAQTWTRDNYNTARLGLDLTGLLLANNANRSANRLAQQQMQMQQQAQQKNAAMADKANAQATQSFNEARSLYNPQEQAVRAMARQQMSTARNMVDARNQMARAGKSKATIDAEMRRAKLQGSTGAATAYTAGLDMGRQAQQQALTAAKGLTSNYNTTADYAGADRVANAGLGQAQQITGMLNNYLGNPVYQQNLAALRRAQQDAYYYP